MSIFFGGGMVITEIMKISEDCYERERENMWITSAESVHLSSSFSSRTAPLLPRLWEFKVCKLLNLLLLIKSAE